MRFISCVVLICFCLTGKIYAQQTVSYTEVPKPSVFITDTLKSFYIKKDQPFVFNANMNHREKGFGSKIGWGTLYASGYNTIILSGLVFAPESFSKWENKEEKFKFSSIMSQYKSAFTKPPVIDHDLWMTNYLGHPYQGAFYYNTVRCQGASVLQSSLFCIGHSLFWEYGWEAGIEQPSIQDMITTPLGGIIVGELAHVATISMSRNGFKWYEIVAVCAINPSYALNNGFRFNKPLKMKN